ncbi:MAG TPA: hypothetical protein VIN36_01360 [Thiobacillus sp.]
MLWFDKPVLSVVEGITTNGARAGKSVRTDEPIQANHSQPVHPEPVEGLVQRFLKGMRDGSVLR